MEKAYKIARSQLGAWKISTQNMSKNVKNCTKKANNFEKCVKKQQKLAHL